MSTETVAAPSPAAVETHFLRNRLGSFLAIAPLGFWVTVHVWNNLASLQGGEAWQQSVTVYQHPFAQAFAAILVFLPLLIHTVWGLSRIFSARANNGSYNYFGNLRFALQRLSALGVLAFLFAHVYKAFIEPRLMEGHAEAFRDIAAEMHWNGPTLPVYLLGTLGVAFHLGNGISNIAMGWGLAESQAGQRRFEIISVVTFLVLLAMSWGAIYGLWAAGTAYGHA